MRATRDLLRHRMHLMRQRAALLTPIQNTNSQHNLPTIGKQIASKANRTGGAVYRPCGPEEYRSGPRLDRPL